MTRRKKRSSGFKTIEVAHYCFSKDTDISIVNQLCRLVVKLIGTAHKKNQKYAKSTQNSLEKCENTAEIPLKNVCYCPKKPGCCWDFVKKEEKEVAS